MGRRIPRNSTKVTDEVMLIAFARACLERGLPARSAVLLAAQCHRESNLLIEGLVDDGDRVIEPEEALVSGCTCYAKDHIGDDYEGDFVSRHVTEWLTTAEKDAALAQATERTDAGGEPAGKATGPNVEVSGTRDGRGRWFVRAWPDHAMLTRFRSDGARGVLRRLHEPRYAAALTALRALDADAFIRAVVAAGWTGEELHSYRGGYDQAVPRFQAVYERTLLAPYATQLGNVAVYPTTAAPLADWGKHWCEGRGIFGWRRDAAGATRWQPYSRAHAAYDHRDYGTTTFVAWDTTAQPFDAGVIRVPSGAWLTRLPLWDTSLDLPARLGALEATRWLADHGGRLPREDEIRQLEHLSPFLRPVTLPNDGDDATVQDRVLQLRGETPGDPDMSDLEWCLIHDVLVLERARAAGWTGEPLAGVPVPAPQAGQGGGAALDPGATSSALPPPERWRRVLRRGIPDGEDIAAWRAQLARDGFPMSIARDFGALTHRLTQTWQEQRGLTADGEVGPATRAKIGTPPIPPRAPAVIAYDAIPVVNAPTGQRAWDRRLLRDASAIALGDRPILWTVVHTTEEHREILVGPGAENTAAWFARGAPMPGTGPTNVASHLVIDADSVVRCVPDERVAAHCGGRGNPWTWGVELVATARQTREQWGDEYSRRQLALAATAFAELHRRRGIPVRWVTAEQLRAAAVYLQRGELPPRELWGMTGHLEIGAGLGGTNHGDPGAGFDRPGFVVRVRVA